MSTKRTALCRARFTSISDQKASYSAAVQRPVSASLSRAVQLTDQSLALGLPSMLPSHYSCTTRCAMAPHGHACMLQIHVCHMGHGHIMGHMARGCPHPTSAIARVPTSHIDHPNRTCTVPHSAVIRHSFTLTPRSTRHVSHTGTTNTFSRFGCTYLPPPDQRPQ